jgi:hypothetical protein
MSNQQIKIGLVAIVLMAIMVFAVTALPAANALTPSTIYYKHSHKTDRFPGGQHICGEQLCSPDVWSKMDNSLNKSQHNASICADLKAWIYCGQHTGAPKTS